MSSSIPPPPGPPPGNNPPNDGDTKAVSRGIEAKVAPKYAEEATGAAGSSENDSGGDVSRTAPSLEAITLRELVASVARVPRGALSALPGGATSRVLSVLARKGRLDADVLSNLRVPLGRVQNLSLAGARNLSEKFLATFISPYLDAPLSVDLSGAGALRSVASLARCSQHIKYLKLRNCRRLDARSAMPVLRGAPALRVVIMSGGTRLEGFPVGEALERAEKLEKCDIQGSSATRGLKALCMAPGRAKALTYLDISGCRFPFNEIKHLGGLRALRTLNMSFTATAAEGGSLSTAFSSRGLSGLRHLDVSRNPRFGDTIVTAIASSCPNLETLNISRTGVTSSGFRTLRSMSLLRVVEAGYNPEIQDNGVIEAIPGLTSLERLGLAYCGVGNDAIIKLSETKRDGAEKLTDLNFSQTGLGEQGLAALSKSTLAAQLKGLDIGGVAINDHGIAHLSALSSVQRLNLWHTSGHPETVATLAKQLGLVRDPQMSTTEGTYLLLSRARAEKLKRKSKKRRTRGGQARNPVRAVDRKRAPRRPPSDTRSVEAKQAPQVSGKMSLDPTQCERPKNRLSSDVLSAVRRVTPSEFHNLVKRARTPQQLGIISAVARDAKIRDAPDKHGRTALMLAAKSRNEAALRRLLNARADASAADRNGNTPLMYAAMAGSTQLGTLLIEAGAGVQARNAFGKDAGGLAQKFGASGLVDAITSRARHGASERSGGDEKREP